MRKKVNLHGMLALLAVAQRIPAEHMNMGHWFRHFAVYGETPHPPHKKKGLYDAEGCGTTACWAGHACCDPEFVAATGVKLGAVRTGVVSQGGRTPVYMDSQGYKHHGLAALC